MFAASVRMPSKRLKFTTGLLPEAISTIMVSPTARPKPIITAEKMPGTGGEQHHAHHRLPRRGAERERALREVAGTLNTASSAIEKIVGITAKPIARPTISALRWS
jgi:hypothetical protein